MKSHVRGSESRLEQKVKKNLYWTQILSKVDNVSLTKQW